MLDPRQLVACGFEVALEVVELGLSLVEGETPQPDLLLGARQPVPRGFLRVLLDPVRDLDGRPHELERLEPRRTVVRGEARRAGVRNVGIGREPLELREGDDVGAGL